MKEKPPLTFTRRRGAAWETAQNWVSVHQEGRGAASPSTSVSPPLTLIVRLDIERQKLVRAMQLLVCSASRQRL